VPGVIKQANLADLKNDFNLLPQAWTLAIEIVLSALVPAGIVLAGRSTVWLLLVAAAGCMLGGLSPFALHFAVGIAMAKHFRAIVAWLEPRPALRLVGGAVGLCLYTCKHLAQTVRLLHLGNTDWYVSGLGAAILLAVISASPALRTWLSRGITHHIGRTSYSLYLSHLLVIFCVTPRIVAVVQHSVHWLYAWSIGLAATCVIAAVLAEAVYWSAEVPAIAFGRWLAGHGGNWSFRTGQLRAAPPVEMPSATVSPTSAA
jgi:peptidoglycan/LPS O-acetylase OafA/YrhL